MGLAGALDRLPGGARIEWSAMLSMVRQAGPVTHNPFSRLGCAAKLDLLGEARGTFSE